MLDSNKDGQKRDAMKLIIGVSTSICYCIHMYMYMYRCTLCIHFGYCRARSFCG